MKEFMDENFLLNTETSKRLYHDYAKNMPICDYHCHINAKEIYEDKKYDNITQAWLYEDHYKWRCMRLFGIEEDYITGDRSDFEKFNAYAKMMPYLIGNPVYHWTHLELKRYFDIDLPLSEETAQTIWDITEKKLQEGFGVRDIIKMSNVKKIYTTDDPLDDLRWHKKISTDSNIEVEVLPSFRPDKALELKANDFGLWVGKLSDVCGKNIENYSQFLDCLKERIHFFKEKGCVISDHGMGRMVYEETNQIEVEEIFKKALNKETIRADEEAKYKTFTLKFLAAMYYELDWVMQLHIGPLRGNNSQMLNKLGPDTGFDSINDHQLAEPLSSFLDSVNNSGLPKTILYTLNPKDNYVLATMMGNFPGGENGSKVQFGCAWWFNDQIDGMKEQLKVFANMGVVSRFVGMLTDSRSFLSYTRHEYFRRILCDLFGSWVENGEYPNNIEVLGKIVEDISFNNSIEYIS